MLALIQLHLHCDFCQDYYRCVVFPVLPAKYLCLRNFFKCRPGWCFTSAMGFPLKSVFYLRIFFSSVEQVQYQMGLNQSLSSFFQAKIFCSCRWHLCMPLSYIELLPKGKLHIKSFAGLSSFLSQFALNKSFLPHISQHGSPSSQRQ